MIVQKHWIFPFFPLYFAFVFPPGAEGGVWGGWGSSANEDTPTPPKHPVQTYPQVGGVCAWALRGSWRHPGGRPGPVVAAGDLHPTLKLVCFVLFFVFVCVLFWLCSETRLFVLVVF